MRKIRFSLLSVYLGYSCLILQIRFCCRELRGICCTREHLLQKMASFQILFYSYFASFFLQKNIVVHLKFWCTCILVWKGWQEPTCRTRCSQKRRYSKELQSWNERNSENNNCFSFADTVERSVTKKYRTFYCTFEPLHHETNIRGGGETVPVVFKYMPGTGILRDGVYAKKVPFQPKKNLLYGPYEVTAEPPFHIGPLHMISLYASESFAHEQLFSPGVNKSLFSHCSRTLVKSRLINFKTQLSVSQCSGPTQLRPVRYL